MDYNILLFKNSDCYKENRKMFPKGIVVHSTGANNPDLKRYVGPNDKRLGYNENNNHWNQPGISTCPHAFIGKDRFGKVCTYQVLPLTVCCYGVGSGSKGSYNYNPPYLQFEMLEDGLKDKEYFLKVMKEAQEVCAKWCKAYGIPIKDIVSHKEAHERGYGSNHGDCENWLSKFDKDMDWFRGEVQKILDPEPNKIIVGDKVKIRSTVNTYFEGTHVPQWVKNSTLYARELQTKNGTDVCLVSTYKTTPVYTGRFKITDLIKVK